MGTYRLHFTAAEVCEKLHKLESIADRELLAMFLEEMDVVYPEDTSTSIDGDTVYAGDELMYLIRYTNLSLDDSITISVTANVPQNTTYVEDSINNNGVYENGKVSWLLDIAPGTEEALSVTELSFKVTVDEVDKVAIAACAEIAESSNTSYSTNTVTVYASASDSEEDEEQ